MNTVFGILLVVLGLLAPILGCWLNDIVDDEFPNSSLPIGICITIVMVTIGFITGGLQLLGVK